MKNLARSFVKPAGALLICFLLSLPAFGDDVAQSGRQIAAKWQDAVVTVQLVIKSGMSYEGGEGQKRESKTEATGTVIDASGLTVISLAATNPSEFFEEMMASEDSEFKMNFSSEVTDVKILLPDGQELPANIVLRDKDFDLAFVRPKEKPAKTLAYVDFTKAVKPGLLDQTVTLYRLGTVASRSIAGCVDRIQSVVEKPRTYYVPGANSESASLGAPVFAIDGNPIGVLLVRTRRTGPSEESSWFSGMSGMGLTYMVLPAADVLEAAKQAPETAEAK